MKNPIKTVGIIGSGPSGATLASLLTMKGVDVTIFDDGRRPDLIVGESLIPAIVPVLRKLGLEERAAAVCQYKPGVSFTFGREYEIDFCFESVKGVLPTYAYNAPRPAFDRLFEERADELGVKRVKTRAKVERDGANGLRLAEETLAHAPWLNGRQPDLLVDSTGRTRLFARTMEIPAQLGPRKDVAYFAHYEGFTERKPAGQVVIGRLDHAGWSWRIPLPGRLSVGVVLNKDEAAQLGETPEERLEAAIARDSQLSAAGRDRHRISEVAVYTNYQLVSEYGYGGNENGAGPGWVMTGDAFGFVDPMLSPGMWLALHSAEVLSENLDNLPAYDCEMRKLIKAWMELIQYFYDGRMFAMYQTGTHFERTYPGKISDWMKWYFNRLIASMASGATTTAAYPRGVIKFMASHGIWKSDPVALAIR
jgi:flavin-dependent dehydrogenase